MQGVPNGMLRLRQDGVLEGKITRSKTSGHSKRIEVMVFFEAKEAFLLWPDWLKTGWDLNCDLSAKAGLQERDYLVPKPTTDLMGFRRAFVKYQDALTMSRALLLALRVDAGMMGKEGADPSSALLTQTATGFWTEDSERADYGNLHADGRGGPRGQKDGGPLVLLSGRVFAEPGVVIRLAQQAVAAMLATG